MLTVALYEYTKKKTGQHQSEAEGRTIIGGFAE